MWIDVSPDLSIVADEIVAIKSINQFNSIVYMEVSQFEVPMPKSVLMSMIESRRKGESSMSNVERLLTQIYQGQATPRP